MPRRKSPQPVRLLTVPEAARELRVSKATVYRLIADGALASVAVGRSGFTRISTEAIAEYRDAHTRAVDPTAAPQRNRVAVLSYHIQKTLSPKQRRELAELIAPAEDVSA